MMNATMQSSKITVRGTVQGVGFRPFVFRLAKQFGLAGYVKNTGTGVEIVLEDHGSLPITEFLRRLQSEKPPLVSIDHIKVAESSSIGFDNFGIESSSQEECFVFIAPDIATCPDCAAELLNPSDRRYLYPFINCTNCGPRYTIIETLPYDRTKTTMKTFEMCGECKKEYENPIDRRFHAEPIGCPKCGPQIKIVDSKTREIIIGGIDIVADFIKTGKIVALKGIGGFHLLCDPHNISAVKKLREVKCRSRKPFALMAKDIETILSHAHVNYSEREFLLSPRRPIVLLKQKSNTLPDSVAPFMNNVGIMLPYTPLHTILLNKLEIVVATSANHRDSPILKVEEEGVYDLCDLVVTHNRPINMRCDDSVLEVINEKPLFLRRARGYVPESFEVPDFLKVKEQILALGGELKNTISIYKDGFIITSQYTGDLKDYRNFKYFREVISHFEQLFTFKPDFVVSDLHPDFQSTRYAETLKISHIKVQHHFAHVLACMLEYNVNPDEKVLGVSLDGMGLGDDRKVWGGEFLLANYLSYKRIAHLKTLPQPGGDLVVKEPFRMSISYLLDTFGETFPTIDTFQNIDQSKIKTIVNAIKAGVNSPLTSSCGRLFDAVAAILGVAPLQVEFEGEAPMRLEAIADPYIEESYDFNFNNSEIGLSPMIRQIISEINHNDVSHIAGKFHNTLAKVICKAALISRSHFSVRTVVLCGGVFLNGLLLKKTEDMLSKNNFRVLRPVKFSPNDESISLGQLAHTLAKLKHGAGKCV
jgi:hydrogenase maturation protein HypF